jgi:ABC-2 type transport system permease protein
MLRAEPIAALWQPFVLLALLGAVVVTGATLRFRRYLAPAGRERTAAPAPAVPQGAAA